jgi:DNA polymerase I-like protein with 3'-5' exonuclease and polymerase domains
MKTKPAQKLRYPKPDDQRAPKPLTPEGVGELLYQLQKELSHTPKTAKPLKGGIGLSPTKAPAPLLTNKRQLFRQLALDTETTGVDLWHGCKPFFVSTCDEEGELTFWQWDVNPKTREVGYWANPQGLPTNPYALMSCNKWINGPPKADKAELKKLIAEHHFILHNTKFDVRALEMLGLPRINLGTCQDTLIASHVLCSNESHGLKELGLQYLNIRDDDQQDLRDATNEARLIGRKLGWAIAQDGGHPHFPATRKAPKAGWWVFDTWLPRAVARFYNYPEDHPWWTVLETYALRDAERTYGLWWLQLEALEQQGLLPLYEERRRLLEAIYEMEHMGVTASRQRLSSMDKKLAKEAATLESRCFEIAREAPAPGAKPKKGFAHRPVAKIDNLASWKQLEGLLYGTWKIRPGKRTATGYSTDAKTLESLLIRPELQGTLQHEFIWKLLAFRGREKSRDYLEEYILRGMPNGTGWLLLHPSFNPTGTDTTRFSSSQPNAQNIGKGGKRDDDPIPSLREIFGPMPGREWFSIDYSNIEMRIFSYKAEDQKLIETFETGYAVHLVFAEILFPTEFAACRKEASGDTHKAGDLFKKKYKTTFYQWTKNGNFALLYGAGRDKADSTYHRPGGYDAIRKNLPRVDYFLAKKDAEAKAYGYITCEGGYRLWVPPTEPHVAVNYYVQGTAGWCMVLAINRVHTYLKTLNERIRRGGPKAGEPTYRMIMTIHDELDFDFPKHQRNKQVIEEIGRIMASSGDAIGIPTPVEISRHSQNWSKADEGVEFNVA